MATLLPALLGFAPGWTFTWREMDNDDIYWDTPSNWHMTAGGTQPRLDCFYPCVPTDQAIIPNIIGIAVVDLVDASFGDFTIRDHVEFDHSYGVPAYLHATSVTFHPTGTNCLEAFFAAGAQCTISTVQGPV